MSARSRVGPLPVAVGAIISIGLWLSDLMRLSGYAFAGVTDTQAAKQVLAVTEPALLSLEMKLAALHLLAGAGCGLLFSLFFRSLSKNDGSLRESLGALVFTLGVLVLSLLAMVGWYPQLFSDRWWLAGGFLASLQRVVTHGIGPRWFDFALVTLLVVAVAPTVLVGARRLLLEARGARLRKSVIALAGILVVLLAFRVSRAAKTQENGSKASLLILASDSLRSDRIEDPAVMPFTASRIPEGSLYRYAVTPIARTYPAWVSTLTGSEPRSTGVRHMFPRVEDRRDVGPSLFTELRDRGYFTFAVSDFAGDIFPGFQGGFESLDTPHLNVDTLAQSTALMGHTWSLPFLRFRFVRSLFPYWRNVPSLADPEWVVDSVIRQMERSGPRPFAGLVFFSAAHFPYVAPYPDYLRGAGDYRGRYLYHVPPVQPEEAPTTEDIEQIRFRYDGAVRSIDRAMERLSTHLASETLVVVTGDHGEELYEEAGIAGHGDTIRYLRSQAVPIFLEGPGVPGGIRSNDQVRHYDLAATVLSLLLPERPMKEFGHGTSLLDTSIPRPICVETGIWFWPGRPLGLRGKRLDYPGISELLELEPKTREMVMRSDVETMVESAKERGLILGSRLYREQLTPSGLEKGIVRLEGPESTGEDLDLQNLFQERCVDGNEDLRRLYGAVVFERKKEGKP